uniref:Uncharacterized protein n=1 Tax=Onchocerca volvulus TaxID=6282 RepID=A0A8R1XWA2_ONCVO
MIGREPIFVISTKVALILMVIAVSASSYLIKNIFEFCGPGFSSFAIHTCPKRSFSFQKVLTMLKG